MGRTSVNVVFKLFFCSLILIFPLALGAQTFWSGSNAGTTENLNGIDFYDSSHGIAVGDNGTILRTNSGGAFWESMNSGTTQNFNGVCYLSSDCAVVVGNGATILRSNDAGTTWLPFACGVTSNLLSVDLNESGNGVIGGTDQSILWTTDFGESWNTVQTGYMGGGFEGAQILPDNTAFVFGSNSIFQPFVGRSTNSGASFSFYNFYFQQGAVMHEGKLFDGYFFDSTSGIAIGRRWDGWGCISTTSDLNNWTTEHYTTPFYAVDFCDQTGFVTGANGTIYISTNAGLNWTLEDSGTNNTLNDVVALNGGFAFAVGDNGTILKRVESTIYVSGDVSGIWSADTVKVVGALTIPDGETLTIEPGTYVEFQGHYKFNVQGQLLAIGTEQDSIIFTVADTTGYYNYSHFGWHGIRFDNTPATNDSSKFYYCHFEYGKAIGAEYEDKQGGVFYINNCSKIHISHSTFYDNYATLGAGIYCSNYSSPIIEFNDISYNSASGENPGDGAGAGISLSNYSSPIIRNNMINHNHAYSAAGISVSESSPIITNNTISYNSGIDTGGILIGNLINSAILMISNNLIYDNQVSFRCGGIKCIGDSLVIFNNTIANNEALLGGGLDIYSSDIQIINNNIWGNSAPDGSQVCLEFADTNPNFYNCNIEGGVAAFGGEGAAGFCGDYENCIDSNPFFVDPQNDNFHLQDSSPCIGAGIDEIEIGGSWYYAPEFDLEGNPRPNPVGSMPDIGTYENQFGEPQAGINENCILKIEDCKLSNYPNPFNPTTTISFELNTETSENTELVIYNLKGQKVKTFLNLPISQSSNQQIIWDGTDDNNKPVSSGIYFYKLKAGDFEQTKKCLLLK
ncbi:MAG: YCF48-related protein [Candidatus Cloacimonadales bacterium]|nr:YCF48-related protein [Candidatus Cloacimonadales bacterium]